MFKFQIFTPEEIFFDDEVVSIVIPGTMGYLGVLKDHAPLITSVTEGVVKITDTKKTKYFYKVKDGFFEVKNNKATLLVDSIEKTTSIQPHLI